MAASMESLDGVKKQLAELFPQLAAAGIVEKTLGRVGMRMGPCPPGPAPPYWTVFFHQCFERLINVKSTPENKTGHPAGAATKNPEKSDQTPKLSPTEIKEWIMDMHPRVDPVWVDSKIAEGYDLNKLADLMMDQKINWPKLEKKTKMKRKHVEAEKSTEQPAETAKKRRREFLTECDDPVSANYVTGALRLLALDFPRVEMDAIRKVQSFFNGHYAPAKKCLKAALANYTYPLIGHDGYVTITCHHWSRPASSTFKNSRILPRGRPPVWKMPFRIAPELEEEQEWMKENKNWDAVDGRAPGTVSTAPPSNLFECQICFEETPIMDCVNCENAHIFCKDCVINHAKQTAYGQGKTTVDCMEMNCQAGFARDVLEKILEVEILGRLDERRMEEDLNAAQLEGLERCKYCNFAVVIDVPMEIDKVLRCGNPECKAEVCRQCGLDWDEDHLGVPCGEMEKDEAATARTEYEEKMSKEVIRYCPKCKIPITKVEGCNRMTCRCGQKMCYLCREKGIDYDHFCGHLLEPGKKCSKCTKCLLWEDPNKTDSERLKAIAKEVETDERIDANHAGSLKVTEPTIPRKVAGRNDGAGQPPFVLPGLPPIAVRMAVLDPNQQ